MLNMIADHKARRDDFEDRRDFLTAAMLIMAGHSKREAAELADRSPVSTRVKDILHKAATFAATTSGSGISNFGAMLGSFMSSVRNIGAFDNIAAASFPMPIAPGRVIIASSVTASTVNEGAAKPIRGLTLAASDFSPVKVVATVVLSNEIIKGLTDEGMRVLFTELRGSVAIGADSAFLTALSENSTEESSSADTFAQFVDDLEELLRLVNVGAGSRLFMIVPPEIAKAVSPQALNAGINLPWNGGVLAGVEMVVSDAQTADRITLVDATGLAIGQTPLELRSSEHAAIQMDTAPSHEAITPTAANLVSLFQTNSRALLAERSIAVKAIRPNAYFHMTGIAIGQAGDSPAMP